MSSTQSGANSREYTVFEVLCPEQDLNLHAVKHMNLNHARLPISPSGHSNIYSITKIFYFAIAKSIVLLSIFSSAVFIKSSMLIEPASPIPLIRTETFPASISLSPITST